MLCRPELQKPHALPRSQCLAHQSAHPPTLAPRRQGETHQLPILDRNRHTRPHQRALDMRRKVIRPYRRQQSPRSPANTNSPSASCRYSASPFGPASGTIRSSVSLMSRRTSSTPHISTRPTHREGKEAHRIPILIQSQPAARVLHKQVQQPDLVRLELGAQLLEHQIGDEVRAARPRGKGELLLGPRHGWGDWGCGGLWWGGVEEGGEEEAQGEGPEEVECRWEEGEEEEEEDEKGCGGGDDGSCCFGLGRGWWHIVELRG